MIGRCSTARKGIQRLSREYACTVTCIVMGNSSLTAEISMLPVEFRSLRIKGLAI